MSIFKTSLKIIRAHKLYILIYLIMLSCFGLFIGLANLESTDKQPVDAKPAIAVIDRDKSVLSQGIRSYALEGGIPVELQDTKRTLQDVTAQDRVQYILVIPEGYGQAFMQAAKDGTDAPPLKTIISYQSAAGSLVDLRVVSYLESLYTFASTIAPSEADALSFANEATSHTVNTSLIEQAASPLPFSLVLYCSFNLYPLFAFTTVSIAVFMAALNKRPHRRRLLASPLSSFSRNFQICMACLAVGILGWLWISGLGFFAFGLGSVQDSLPLLGITALALLSYALNAVAIGFLLATFGLSENAVNALANIGGMGLSFLGGAWVPLDFLPDALVAFAHFTPAYWCTQAITQAAEITALTPETLLPLLGYVGIGALFALAIMLVAFAVGRARHQAA